MTFTTEHIAQIKQKDVANHAEKYTISAWKELATDFLALVKEYEGKTISRQQIIDSYADYYLNKSTVIKPFIMTMIWGFSGIGYGRYRTQNYLSTDENINKITAALDLLKNDYTKEAYEKLLEISGLSISYISKVLYFASKALNHEQYCLIFDIRVAVSLVKINSGLDIADILVIYPSEKYAHYKQYNEMMHKLANEINVAADQIEMFLFDFDKNKLK